MYIVTAILYVMLAWQRGIEHTGQHESIECCIDNEVCSNCSHVWHIYTKTQLNKLRITYNNALIRLFNLHPRCSTSVLFAYNHMPSLDEIRRKYMCRFTQILNCTDNSILLCFISSTNMFTSSRPIWRKWYRCLYIIKCESILYILPCCTS